ncbi:MAG: amino acid racemase [Pseudomonadota bacterium]
MSQSIKSIGVLGGMGPEATILFMQKMMQAVQASDDKDHIPLIVHNNTQVPSRIDALIHGTGEDPGPSLAEMATSLEAAGAKALAMPCNTAHHYAPVVEAAAKIPFLNMVELAADKALQLSGKAGRIGVLGSPALNLVGVFDKAFENQGLTAVTASDPDRLLSVIRDIKKNGATPEARAALQVAANDMVARGADVAMICCTEFSLIADDLKLEIPVFDTLDALVDACVSFSLGTATIASERGLPHKEPAAC